MALEVHTPRLQKPARDDKQSRNLLSPSTRAPNATDRMFFTEQLALLLETGESLYSALTTIAKQTEKPQMRTIVEQVAQDVSEGLSLGKALSRHDTVFSSTYVNLVGASESGGFIHDVLQQLLNMDHRREQLRTTLVSAATYPLFLLSFSIAVVVFVLVVVFPKFGTMFESIYDQLPVTTKALMAASDVMRQHWIWLLSALGAIVVLARQWLISDQGRSQVDAWKLRLPGIRDVYIQMYLVQSLQVLGLSLVNGVSVMEALQACRDVVRNSRFRQLISDVEASVQSGAGVAAGFEGTSFVPDLAKHMIMTGEQTGNLGKVMSRISDYYENLLLKRLEALSKLAEPMMLLVMGIIVGVLVSSLILPIFKLSRAVS